MIRAFRRFREDERGAAAFLMVCGIVPLVLLVFFMVNTAKSINDKNRAQDAADAIALAHATETARALNTISMNQVTLTQAYATGVNAGTLNDTLNINLALLIANEVAIQAFAAKCAANVGGGVQGVIAFAACELWMLPETIELALYIIWTKRIQNKFSPKQAFKTAADAVKAANKMNVETVNRFPEAVQSIVEPIAKTIKVTDIYFDQSCAAGSAKSCDPTKKRQGMELPVNASSGIGAPGNLHFCGALFYGTGGLSFAGLGGSIAINGSYLKRGFKPNVGPMRSGSSSNPLLYDHINKKTGVGRLLRRSKAVSDRVRSKTGGMGITYPTAQTNSSNVFLNWVKLRIGLKCSGLDGAGSPVKFLQDLLKGIFSTVPEFQIYHPMNVGTAPKILPSIDDFSEAYKPLAFVFRKPNARWAPELFKPPKPGFYAYAQAISYNPDEIGLYSQNWAARLIPAKKMDNLSPILSRMSSRASSSFDSLRERMARVTDMAGWREINAH